MTALFEIITRKLANSGRRVAYNSNGISIEGSGTWQMIGNGCNSVRISESGMVANGRGVIIHGSLNDIADTFIKYFC